MRKSYFYLLLVAIFFTYHCDKKSGVIIDSTNQADCVSDEKYFQTNIWNPIIRGKGCFGCHRENGVAESSATVDWGLTEDLSTNFATLKRIANSTTGVKMLDGRLSLLYKATLPIGTNVNTQHAGGIIYNKTSVEFTTMQQFVDRTNNPSTCTSSSKIKDVPQGIVLAGYIETLQKAGLSLIGRIPTKVEEDQVYESGFQGLQKVLDEFMNEKSFYDRLRELFNDLILTDKFIFSNILDNETFVNATWYDNLNLPTNSRNALRNITRLSIARSPVELMVHVVKNNEPFSEIVTANYMMVNPFSARSYGVLPSITIKDNDIPSSNDYNQNYKYLLDNFYKKYNPVVLNVNNVAIPHAGILTDNAFLLRYPTTRTNVNRHRAHNILKIFLNFDILKEINLPNVDLSNLPDVNPTFTNPACTGCHIIMDPIAGLFKNWDQNALYSPRDWFDKISLSSNNYSQKMRVVGLSEFTPMPAGYDNNSLQWLGQKIKSDARFAKSITSHILRALTGAKYIEPGQPGYDYQNSIIEKYSVNFSKSNFNFKNLIKEIISGPYFRAKNVLSLVAVNENDIFDIGIGRMLTPEQLSRKIKSVLGQNWSVNPWDPEDIPYLLSRYKLLYGGIDSNTNTVRVSTPNAVMANIQMRMATSMACQVVAKDFGILDKNSRSLFTFAEKEFIPFTASQAVAIPVTSLEADCALTTPTGTCNVMNQDIYHGNNDTTYSSIERADAVLQIKRNIQHLHKKILGEILPIFDAEINNTYKLWRATYTEYALANDKTLDSQCMNYNRGDINIYSDENYTIKAWQAVITYLLSDYRFVFE